MLIFNLLGGVMVIAGLAHGLGQNGWGPGYGGGFSLQAAAVFEVVATALLGEVCGLPMVSVPLATL